MNGARDAILARIAEALRAPARPSHPVAAAADATADAHSAIRAWLPHVSEAPSERLALFVRQCHALSTELRECADDEDAARTIAQMARDHGWQRIASHHGPLIDPLMRRLPAACKLLHVEAGYDREALEQCDAGVTECESLVAQTGSVCVSARSSGGRALSVFPPHHLVVARRGQLVADLSEAIDRLFARYPGGLPSFVSFISGPSRTGDIERILVLGAHGPRKLTVLLVP